MANVEFKFGDRVRAVHKTLGDTVEGVVTDVHENGAVETNAFYLAPRSWDMTLLERAKPAEPQHPGAVVEVDGVLWVRAPGNSSFPWVMTGIHGWGHVVRGAKNVVVHSEGWTP